MKARMLALLLTAVMLIAPLQGAFAIPTQAAEWSTDYRTWSQSDPLWGSRLIGVKTMSSVGCLVVAVAKLMVHAGQRDPETFNPGICLSEMQEKNVFHGTDSVYFAMLDGSYFPTYAPELTEVYHSGTLSSPMTETQAAESLQTFIDNGYYIIVMTNTVRNTTHWMAVDEIADGHVMVMDNKAVIDLYASSQYNGVARYLLVKYSGNMAYPASAGITDSGTVDPGKLDRTETYTSPAGLRIRSTPSLSGQVLGSLAEGERVRIRETVEADGYVWGRLDMGGWCAISLCTYVSGSLYYVIYDGNGGSGVPDYQPNPYGQTVTLSSEIPEKEGRTFLGWSTDPDAPIPEYAPGDSVDVDSDLTLYAVWDRERSETYTAPDLLRVRTEPNLSSDKLYNLAEGTRITICETAVADGYTWGRLAEGGWCAISICTYVSGALNYIFYDKNGGSGGIAYQPNPTDQSVTISSDIPTKTGCSFLGYAETPDGSPVYQPGDTISQNADLTLYAVWSDPAGCTDEIVQKNGRLYLTKTFEGDNFPGARELSVTLNGSEVLLDPESVEITSEGGLTTVRAEIFGVATVKDVEITLQVTLGDATCDLTFTPVCDAAGYDSAAVAAYRSYYNITLYSDAEIPFGSTLIAVADETGEEYEFTVNYRLGRKIVLTCEKMDAGVRTLTFEGYNFAVLITATSEGVNVLTCPDDQYFAPYYQTKRNESDPGRTDLRFVILANMDKLSAVESADVSIRFYSGDSIVREMEGALGGPNSTYQLFTALTAAGEIYVAAEGCAIFGQEITGVPKGAFTRITLQITDRTAGTVLLSVEIDSGV